MSLNNSRRKRINPEILPEHVLNILKEEVKIQFPDADENEVISLLENYPTEKTGGFYLARTSEKYGNSQYIRREFWNQVLNQKKYNLISSYRRTEHNGEIYYI